MNISVESNIQKSLKAEKFFVTKKNKFLLQKAQIKQSKVHTSL